jgi:hypothetical protein
MEENAASSPLFKDFCRQAYVKAGVLLPSWIVADFLARSDLGHETHGVTRLPVCLRFRKVSAKRHYGCL